MTISLSIWHNITLKHVSFVKLHMECLRRYKNIMDFSHLKTEWSDMFLQKMLYFCPKLFSYSGDLCDFVFQVALYILL